MLKAFGDISKQIKLSKKLAVVDNNVFRLHYRLTFLFFLGATVLVSSRQYIGEHIRCIADKGVATHVLETYCFFTTTFTVVRHLNQTLVNQGHVPHAGVGPMHPDDPIIVHAYYQWVPFVLFFQALAFYVPHWIWKNLEGGRVLAMVAGFENAAMALRETAIKLKGSTVPSRQEYEGKVSQVRQAFLDRLHVNKHWAGSLIICEMLNAVNLVAQIYLTDVFLGGGFLTLGVRVVAGQADDVVDPLDLVFPKMTKCVFWKYGPSGSIQIHDALCVMALNIVNEKIYTFLWFWMLVLAAATASGIVWRCCTFIFHSDPTFNKHLFRTVLDRNSLKTITTRCDFSDWLFLYYIGKSMNSYVFRELIKGLAFEMEEEKLAPEKREEDTEKQLLPA